MDHVAESQNCTAAPRPAYQNKAQKQHLEGTAGKAEHCLM